jgi:hypothetical protein
MFKVLLDITSPPCSHGQLYVALSKVRDCKNIVMYLTEEQLMMSSDSRLMDLMPTVNNIFYQDVLVLTAKGLLNLIYKSQFYAASA